MQDSFLVQQILAGRTDAYRVLVLRYQKGIFKFIRSFRLSSTLVEELAQEAFLKAYKNLSQFDRSLGSFSVWLYTIAKNLALNELSRSSYLAEIAHSPAHEEEQKSHPWAVAPMEATQNLLEGHQLNQNLHQALSTLPIEYRNCITLSYLKELSLEDIAAIENCALGTVKSRIFRGKKLLRDYLESKEISN